MTREEKTGRAAAAGNANQAGKPAGRQHCFSRGRFCVLFPVMERLSIKRRVRLVKTYHAIKAGRFVQDRHRRKSVNVDAFPTIGATDTKSARGAERDKA